MKYSFSSSCNDKGLVLYTSPTKNPELMGISFGCLFLGKGNVFPININEEVAIVLLKGKVFFEYGANKVFATRKDCFHEQASVLHLSSSINVTITGLEDNTQLAIASISNERQFPSVLYLPEDIRKRSEVVDNKILGGHTKRFKQILFGKNECQNGKLFMGEIINFPGCWACFPPHLHKEPELYFYKFWPQSGYGFSEFGDDAYKVKENDMVGVPGYLTHSQSTAPGYAGYILWIQRYFNDQDITYYSVPSQEWINKENTAFWTLDEIMN